MKLIRFNFSLFLSRPVQVPCYAGKKDIGNPYSDDGWKGQIGGKSGAEL